MKCPGALAILLTTIGPAQTYHSRRSGWWDILAQAPRFRAPGMVARKANAMGRTIARQQYDWMLAQARKDLPAQKKVNPAAEYSLDMRPTVVVDSPFLASAYWQNDGFFAGAHGTTSYVPLNVAKFGSKVRTVRLADLFRKGVDPVAICGSALLRTLEARKSPPMWVQTGEWSKLTKDQAEQFVLSRKGVTWLFENYTLGPYAEGTWKVLVPFDRLRGLDRRGVLRFLR